MTPWVTRLLFVNVIVFMLSASNPQILRDFSFVPAWVVSRPWTVFTYMFLHAGFMHLFFNMLGLFFFGPRLENRLGSRDFLILYFLSGLGGALLSVFFAPNAAIVGASGAVFGVLLGFALFWPTEPIYIWGIVPIQARWLVALMAGLALSGGFSGSSDGVAHFAHLGGFLAALIYLKFLQRVSPARQFTRQLELAQNAPRTGEAHGDLDRWRKIDRGRLHEVNREEVERIFKKVSAAGVGSLTLEERAFLDRFSALSPG